MVKYDLYGVFLKAVLETIFTPPVLQCFREHFDLSGKETMPVRLCHLPVLQGLGRGHRPEVKPHERKMQAEHNT